MCGIFGVFNYNKLPVNRDLLKEATNLMSHRGPDGEGFYFDDKNGLGFGHRRLSIIDLQTGDQPMSNEDGTIWIVFNGEIYNYKELRDELISKGHRFRTNSDTEVIIHSYEEYGLDCPNKFNGIFAFAIWDSISQVLFLARDHFGVKPLYYFDDGDKFIFSSEYKSILKYVDRKPIIDETGIVFCLTFRQVPAPNTLIKDIKKLPASYFALVKRNNYYTKSYWNKTIYVDYSKTEKEWTELLTEKIDKAVQRQMVADVPIGISLSGGIDSGIILALMNKYYGKGVHAFTIGFEGANEKINELKLAKQNAERFGAEFNYRLVGKSEYLNFLDNYIWHLEEPVGNESAIAYYFVAEMAKGKVKVLLNGQGADEPFAGYDKYIGLYYAEKFNIIPSFFYKFMGKLIPDLRKRKQLNQLFQISKFQNDLDKILLASEIVNENQRLKIFNESLKNYSAKDIFIQEIKKLLNERIKGNVVEKILFMDLFFLLSENLLLSEDKMAMAASIEARVPFLDIELIETAISIPAKYKIKLFSGKYIHKKVCEKFLPKEVVYQKKIGFSNPMDRWIKEELGKKFLDYIQSANSITNNFLNRAEITRMYFNHKNGIEDNQRFMFLLLSLEKWRQLFLG